MCRDCHYCSATGRDEASFDGRCIICNGYGQVDEDTDPTPLYDDDPEEDGAL
jgi:hypothetical protein